MGSERITLKGAIYAGFKGGLKQLDTLRSIGAKLQPLGLTTGYDDDAEPLAATCSTPSAKTITATSTARSKPCSMPTKGWPMRRNPIGLGW
ncbi:hypothetical protein TU84_12210 [Pseudomonas helleri]|nr:hypothetical protein TU84_12210 [Pseudomonas helleri]